MAIQYEQLTESFEKNSPGPFPLAELASFCLLKLNRVQEAESLLARKEDGHECAGRGYYLGVALAHRGRIGEAVCQLNAAQERPGYGDAARELLLVLLKRQAEQKIAMHDWSGAIDALSQALQILPSSIELQQMLSALGHRLPVTYLKGNRRAEAASAWEKAQREDSGDAKVTHCLGLLYFWQALELEEQQKGGEASDAWRGAIRNWVALSHSDAFWKLMRKEREPVYGRVPDAAVDGLRHRMLDSLSRKIADLHNEYLGRGSGDDANRMDVLSLELAAEIKTADALRRVRESLSRQKEEADLPPLCGAIMLRHLGKLEKAQELLARIRVTQSTEGSTEDLYWCLSPWVFPWIMIQERRYEEAIRRLKDDLRRNPSSEDGNDLLAAAYLERGRLQAEADQVEEALDSWKAGLSRVRARKNTGDKIRQEAENAAVRKAMLLQKEDPAKGLDRAAELLEKVRKEVTDSQRIKENLSELYTTIGIREANDESQAQAARLDNGRKHLEKALELNPGNGRAKTNLGILLKVQALELHNKGRYVDSIALLRRAFQLAPHEGNIRSNLSLALSNYGVHCWNQGLRNQGNSLIREALEIDPGNEHARKNAGTMGIENANDIDAILRMLKNRR